MHRSNDRTSSQQGAHVPETYRILSIDGGGIRGIIPAMVLTELERQTGRAVCEMFDLIAGTSTGGILALALALPRHTNNPEETSLGPRSARDLVRLYEEEGETIFSRSAWRAFSSLGNLTDEKYSHLGLEKVLKQYFGEETMLSGVQTDVLIPSYELERRIPFFFKSKNAKARPESHDFPAWEIARATSAAPTYFEPHKLDARDEKDYFSLADGGIFANNPAMCAFVEALSDSRDIESVIMVSLGTGELTHRLAYEDTVDWGLARWAQPILDSALSGVADSVHYQLEQIFSSLNGDPHYYRFQVRLDEGTDSLDNASRTNIRNLKLAAERLLRDQKDAVEQLVQRLQPGASNQTSQTSAENDKPEHVCEVAETDGPR